MIAAGLVFAGGLAVGASQFAGAASPPSISQVEKKVNALQSSYDKDVQQFDAASTQLTAAKARLHQVNAEVTADNARYQSARKKVVQIAAANYEDSGQTSLAGLLTSSDPGTVLSEASIITELTGARNLQTQDFLTDAQQLTSVQQEQSDYEHGIEQLTDQRASKRNSAKKSLDQETAYLNNLTAQQKATVQATTVGGSSSTAVNSKSSAGGTYSGPTSSQADKAVEFVYDQLGCPYVYGGTGPCTDGFDCSGLVQAAWAYAGIAIPRDTYSQYAALPHIPMSDLEPGDLIFYNGLGHVAMYVGGGDIIDAPRTGLDVEKIPMSTSWYADSVVGAARP
ncbi:MAG TPA: NlpC/P60 family protein [Trebonia sp.]|nr:NlpC/P60 family protein [Trebonia sp.]